MKHLFTLLLIFCTLQGNCQIEKPIKKGNITLGGGIGFSYSAVDGKYKFTDSFGETIDGTNDQKTFSVYFQPAIGYFVLDGFVLGISSSFSYTRYKHIEYVENSYSIGITPFAKYYFTNGFFAGFKLSYAFSGSHGSTTYYKSKHSLVSASPGLGYAIFINPKVSLEPSLEYTYEKRFENSDGVEDYDLHSHRIYFNIGFQIFL